MRDNIEATGNLVDPNVTAVYFQAAYTGLLTRYSGFARSLLLAVCLSIELSGFPGDRER